MSNPPGSPLVLRTVLTLLLFFVTWLLWSGIYVPLLLVLGAASCVLVTVLAKRIGFFDLELYALHLSPRLPSFWFWLIKEIFKANFEVARIVLSPRMPIQPQIITIDATDLPGPSQATLANAITLTPGTLTLDIDSGQIEVHCLTADSARELKQGEMSRRAAKLTGG